MANKISIKPIGMAEKLGFCTFSTASNVVFNFKDLFYLFFLTNVMGISIAHAGMITAIGGGILRDLFVVRMPGVFHKHVYALPCILGACMYLVMIRTEVNGLISIPIVMTFIFVFRMLAAKYRWNLPKA